MILFKTEIDVKILGVFFYLKMANTVNKDFLLFEIKYSMSLKMNYSSLENVYAFWHSSMSIFGKDLTLKLSDKGNRDGSPKV